jgi:hypothetical protein
MGNLFGSQAAEPAPAPAVAAGAGRREVSEADRATLKLQIQRDKLQQHTKKVRGSAQLGWAGGRSFDTAAGPPCHSGEMGRGWHVAEGVSVLKGELLQSAFMIEKRREVAKALAQAGEATRRYDFRLLVLSGAAAAQGKRKRLSSH